MQPPPTSNGDGVTPALCRGLWRVSASHQQQNLALPPHPLRLQALALGDLSDGARRQAALLANDADLRLQPPKGPKKPSPMHPARDPRLPKPKPVLHRRYQGTIHAVQVLADGFIYQNTTYRSLSAV